MRYSGRVNHTLVLRRVPEEEEACAGMAQQTNNCTS